MQHLRKTYRGGGGTPASTLNCRLSTMRPTRQEQWGANFAFRVSNFDHPPVTTHQSRLLCATIPRPAALWAHAHLGSRGDRMSGLAGWVRLRTFAFRLVVALFIVAIALFTVAGPASAQ